jgi:hypothetical protein
VHAAAVGDEDVTHEAGRVVYGEDLKAAPEERVSRICNLDLLCEGFLPLVI